jgi:4-carboxymuconolactone decarboxylase
MSHATHPRISPLPWEEMAPEEQKLAKLGADEVIRVLARNPSLLKASSGLGEHLLAQGKLHPRVRELAILRVALRCEAPYEWANHVPAALGAGATADEINALSDPAAVWSPEDDAVLRAADELCAAAFVSDETWTALAAAFDEATILEVLFLVGYYRMMAGFLNSTGVAVRADQPVLGERVVPAGVAGPVVADALPLSGEARIDGTWHITFTHPAGSKELVLSLETVAGGVTGSIVDTQLGVTVPIVSGSVDGHHLEFTAVVTDPARFDIGVVGTVGGDVFTGSVTISGGGTFPFSGVRAG